MNKEALISVIEKTIPYKRYGKVIRVVGLMIESEGPAANIGEVCYIHTSSDKGEPILAEVVGFQNEKIILMPYREVNEVGSGCLVEATGNPLNVKVGRSLIGHVLDPLGKPLLDGEALPKGLTGYQTERKPPNPLSRPTIRQPLQVGVRAIDGFLSMGIGQRVGLFAGSGVGKSTLLGMIARNSNADVNIIALIGERGREVREFIEHDLGEEGLKKSIIVAATSDQPALMRIRGAYTATAISEYFREQGFNVNLMMDSVTRVAMAQREIGLAVGEPPTTKGYTPSVFSILPKLLERAGTDENGSITGFYTVLVDGDDMNEPIADAVRGILDGHIVLDRKIAERGQYPAINVLKSISRVMNVITTDEHQQIATKLRTLLAVYEENNELISIGAYKKGTNPEVDLAVASYPNIVSFLKQGVYEQVSFEETVQMMKNLVQ
ncbi:flagellum-specific ATP synthase [Oceanobacillus oncorhynchi subsp. incaldanensis]|uniref:flagellar protein export ATPase FliI n=1 Tax=Oceanobacillus oncorhynchi TaxID=545501 RepID=UPI001B2DDE88|nr:flagellar protein export ATPase FliI [Oceanobacillus oncorhynchi]GIO18379.1 flagellum-specific ATP synthase [Oceanobacillus oncorhynchi subsp. incaldanensis]